MASRRNEEDQNPLLIRTKSAYAEVAVAKLDKKDRLYLSEVLLGLGDNAEIQFLRMFATDGAEVEFEKHEFYDLLGQVGEEEYIHGVSVSFQKSVWQKRAKAWTREAKQAIQDLKDVFTSLDLIEIYDFCSKRADWKARVDDKLHKVRKVWDVVDPEFFFRSFSALEGADLEAFTESLLFEVPNKKDAEKRVFSLGQLWNFLPTARLMSFPDDIIMKRSKRGLLDDKSTDMVWEQKGMRTNILEELFPQVAPALAFTTSCLPFRLDEYPQILVAIKNTSERSLNNEHLKGYVHSLFIRAILTHAWQGSFGRCFSVQTEFYFNMFSQIFGVVLLMWVSDDARAKRMPPGLVILTLAALAIATFMAQVFEVGATVRWRVMYGDQKTVHVKYRCFHYFKLGVEYIFMNGLWTFLEFTLSIYGVVLILGLGLMMFKIRSAERWETTAEHWETTVGTWLYNHPMWITCFVFLKCQQVIHHTLAIRAIGEQVVPAFKALFDETVAWFVFFLGLVWFSSFLTYYAIPVQLVPTSWWENIWAMMVLMFRLDFSGDFSLEQLEGLNEQLVIDLHGTHASGEIEDTLSYKTWHHGVHVLYMVFFLFVNVGLLNVLIGIVGNNYDRFYSIRKDVFENHRAVYSYKILVRRATWNGILKTCCMKRNGVAAEETSDDINNMWLKFNPHAFPELDSGQAFLRRHLSWRS